MGRTGSTGLIHYAIIITADPPRLSAISDLPVLARTSVIGPIHRHRLLPLELFLDEMIFQPLNKLL